MNREVVLTADGSTTLLDRDKQITYHSLHGAVQESVHVFIRNGLEQFLSQNEIQVLEMGYGSGLNALLTWNFAQLHQKKIEYTTFEKFPLEADLVRQLHFATADDEADKLLQLHQSSWGLAIRLSEYFSLTKLNDDFLNCTIQNKFNLVYYDAFAPSAQPELWTPAVFRLIYNALDHNGMLVTYCAKGQVKRDLKSVGFNVETLSGPPGKREMIRALKK
ncbi:MAG TPA: tRNA (5-methylaminomethyl-2-thiouridine)(34)-methyltransferase MnmD [Chitinophagales bacterium]|nr:tRNA (5-methylaminomethyl-2-thiouridine)(34)-methyltransferase MnmD [Chitinophagales bacterium]